MADNTPLNLGSGGDTIATDDLSTLNGGASGTVKVQRVKVGFGVDGDLKDVHGSQALPIAKVIMAVTGTISTQNLNTSTAATALSAVVFNFAGESMCNINITGTYTASGGLVIQYSGDTSSTTWELLNSGDIRGVNAGAYNFTIASGFTGNIAVPAYAKSVRIAANNGAVTGTATINITGGHTYLPPNIQRADIATVGGSTVGVGDGAVTLGTTRVVQATKTTYRASTIIPLVAAVTVNVPFFNIIGSASKTVTVKRIKISGMTLSAVGYFTVNVEKLSTASTSGTSSTLVATSLDSSNAAVTAVVKAYTVAPTKGTLVGTLDSYRTLWQASTAVAGGFTDSHVFNFGDISGDGGVVLRGVAQELALTFPVVLTSAGTIAVSVEWTEE